MLSWLLSWSRYRGLRRELYFTLGSLLCGFVLAPVLIWRPGIWSLARMPMGA